MSLPDAELIRRTIGHDDRAAFGELVSRHQSAVRHFLRHLTRGDAATADDLAQETFVTAYRSLPRLQTVATFRTWLLGIAHNHWRNGRRRTRDYESLDGEYTEDPMATGHSLSDLHQDLAFALERLTADERVALHLAFQQSLSHTEIAALLRWPLGTVKTQIARGKEKLRSLLAPWNPNT